MTYGDYYKDGQNKSEIARRWGEYHQIKEDMIKRALILNEKEDTLFSCPLCGGTMWKDFSKSETCCLECGYMPVWEWKPGCKYGGKRY